MVKRHLKRLAAPKTWQIRRKGLKFLTRPNPGAHSMDKSLAINVVIKEMLKIAETTKEVKSILTNRNVLIDGKRRYDYKYPMGIFDVVDFKDTNEAYRMIINSRKKMDMIKIDKEESNLKLSQVIGKSKVKKLTQLNMSDGRCILVDKDEYKTGDTLLITLPEQKIKQSLKFEKGKMIMLVGGKHLGTLGTIVDILGKNITYKNAKGEIFETLKKYAFVVGENKPLIKITK